MSEMYDLGAYRALVDVGLVKAANEGGGEMSLGPAQAGEPPQAGPEGAPQPSDEELEQILSQMSPEELQHILGDLPEEQVGGALGGMDEQHLEGILSQLPPDLIQAMLIGLQAQGGDEGGAPPMEGGEAPPMMGPEGMPEEAPMEEEVAEAGPGAPGGNPFAGKGGGKGGNPFAGKGGGKKPEKKEEKGEKKEPKEEKAEKTAAGWGEVVKGVGRQALTHGGIGAGLGAGAGALTAGEGNRTQGAIRGGVVGGTLGAGVGAGRQMLGTNRMAFGKQLSSMAEKAGLGSRASRGFEQASDVARNFAPGMAEQLGGQGAGKYMAAGGLGAGTLAAAGAGRTAHREPTMFERLKSHMPFMS